MNIEGLGASLVDQLLAQTSVRDFGDLYHLDVATLENLVVTPEGAAVGPCRPRKLGKVGRERLRADRAQQGERPVAADLRARHPSRRREGRRDAGAAPPDHGRACSDAPRRSAAGGAGDRAGASRRRCALFADEPRNRALVATPGRQPASAWTTSLPEPDRRTSAGPLAGKTFVLTGTLASMTREEAAEALEALGAKVSRDRSARRRPALVARRRRREQAREGARSSASRSLDEEAVSSAL